MMETASIEAVHGSGSPLGGAVAGARVGAVTGYRSVGLAGGAVGPTGVYFEPKIKNMFLCILDTGRPVHRNTRDRKRARTLYMENR